MFLFIMQFESICVPISTLAQKAIAFFSRAGRLGSPKSEGACTPNNKKKILTRAIFDKSSNKLYISKESLINLVYSLSMINQLCFLGKIRRRFTVKRMRFLLFSLLDIDYRYRNKIQQASINESVSGFSIF